MQPISSLLPMYAQVPIDFFSKTPKEIHIALAVTALFLKIYPPIATLALTFSAGFLGTRLVIKLVSPYSTNVLKSIQKHAMHASNWISKARMITALATLILLNFTSAGLLIIAGSGSCFALIRVVNDTFHAPLEQPKRDWLNFKGES